jgi:phage gp29-like protein
MSRMKLKTQEGRLLQRKLPRGTVLNRSGQVVQAVGAPVGASTWQERLNRLNAWREEHNPLRGLTISRAISLLEDYQGGRMADLQWAFFFVEQTDPDLIALLALRIGRIVEMDYNLDPEDGADKALVEEQTAAVTEKLALIDNLYEGIEHWAMAPFRGFSHVEKHYKGEDVTHLEPVDQWNVIRDGLRGPWKYNPTARSTDYLSMRDTPDLPMEQFLYRECRRPINRYGLLKFVRSGLSEKDWDAFNEIYNVPGGVVVGPADIPDGEGEIYEAAARRVAEGGSGYLPHGSTYTPNEMPHDPQTFKLRLDFLSEKLVLAGTGGKLTMLTESGSGTLAGGAHSEVFDRIASAEAKRISEIVNTGLIAPILEAEFPKEDHVVFFNLAANEETNSGAAVDQVQKLSSAGFDLDPEQVTQKTGWKVTRKPAPVQIPVDGLKTNPAKEETPASVKNRASNQAAGREARFLAKSQGRLTAGDQATLWPLLERAAALDGLSDEEFADAYRLLMADLPALEQQILGDQASPELEDAFDEVIGTALASGALEAAEARQTAKNTPAEKKPNKGPGPKMAPSTRETAPAGG